MANLRQTRVLARRGNRALLFYTPAWAVFIIVGLVCAIATTAIVTGYLLAAAIAAGVVVLAWLGLSLQVARLAPAGRGPDRPAPPGGAGVREPLRPLPNSPAGAAAMPIPDEQAAA
ncbi:hypothetical protein Rhe02_19840 [Rhizocola hellebori]|uniref:Uncharacterized protein n=1 Tax=Rhizocola hellebori TaxID=1392758 RepID=A0A8J3Q5R6_9ACTN|nr:hypothetical protein [Rhizocola hellebori]GIH03917.1 hypothetical protein Rhe02_19840 [Rhizocola hellebori]